MSRIHVLSITIYTEVIAPVSVKAGDAQAQIVFVAKKHGKVLTFPLLATIVNL